MVLAPAAWRLDPADLPGRHASAPQWRAALTRYRDREGVPRWVYLGDTDHRLRLDLTQDLDAHQLRLHLDRAYADARVDAAVTVTEAADDTAWGWIDGRAHELAVPLASRADPTPRPAVLSRVVLVTGRETSAPAAGPVVSALIDCDPRAVAAIITRRLPQLAEALDSDAAVDAAVGASATVQVHRIHRRCPRGRKASARSAVVATDAPAATVPTATCRDR